jgi:hypothetical protein
MQTSPSATGPKRGPDRERPATLRDRLYRWLAWRKQVFLLELLNILEPGKHAAS